MVLELPEGLELAEYTDGTDIRGLQFVFGGLYHDGFDGDALISDIEARGGKVCWGISSATDYFVVNFNGISSRKLLEAKRKKEKGFGFRIITLNNFLDMLNQKEREANQHQGSISAVDEGLHVNIESCDNEIGGDGGSIAEYKMMAGLEGFIKWAVNVGGVDKSTSLEYCAVILEVEEIAKKLGYYPNTLIGNSFTSAYRTVTALLRDNTFRRKITTDRSTYENASISLLGVSIRLKQILKNNGIYTIDDLISYRPDELEDHACVLAGTLEEFHHAISLLNQEGDIDRVAKRRGCGHFFGPATRLIQDSVCTPQGSNIPTISCYVFHCTNAGIRPTPERIQL